MSVLNTLPAPVIQMGLVEKIADMAQNQPQIQQQATQEAALQSLKEQNARVAKTEQSRHGRKIQDREAGGNAPQNGDDGSPRRAREEEPPSETPASDGSPSQANPWAGHLVNVKI